MTRTVSRRRKVSAATVAGTLLAIAAFTAVNAALIDAGFEYGDGNTTATSPAIDWNAVYQGTSGYTAVSYAQDHDYTNEQSMYTIGSKDVNDVSTWGWRVVGEVPDKTDLLNAIAAKDGNQLYFATDRYATNGDAKVGFWFLQDDVALVGTGGGTFSGQHKAGDILIESLFPKGGKIEAQYVKVWEWVGGNGTAGHLELMGSVVGGDCTDAAVATYDVCLTVNQTTTTSAWGTAGKYTSKFSKGDGHSYAPGAFIEGAIDLGKIYGAAIPCYGAFTAETRSSGSSVTSELKDFVLGDFDTCGKLTIRKVVAGANGSWTFTSEDLTPSSFSLTGSTDGTHFAAANQQVFSRLEAGTYSVTETQEDDYELIDVTCGGHPFTLDGSTVTVDIASGDDVVCTFTNGQTPTLRVVKQVVPANDPGRFDLLLDGTVQTHDASSGDGYGPLTLEPDTYTVSEADGTNTHLGDYRSSISCSGFRAGGTATASGTTIDVTLTWGDAVICTITNNAIPPATTRTQGYWSTHPQVMRSTWTAMSSSAKTLCSSGGSFTSPLVVSGGGADQVNGGFWSNVSSLTTGARRSNLGKARMTLLQQLLAAMLNVQYFGAGNGSIVGQIATAKTAFCSGNATQVNTSAGIMGAYNQSGDTGTMDYQHPADSTGAQASANKVFWDAVR